MAYSSHRLSLEIVGESVLNESIFSSLDPRATNPALTICFPSEAFSVITHLTKYKFVLCPLLLRHTPLMKLLEVQTFHFFLGNSFDIQNYCLDFQHYHEYALDFLILLLVDFLLQNYFAYPLEFLSFLLHLNNLFHQTPHLSAHHHCLNDHSVSKLS